MNGPKEVQTQYSWETETGEINLGSAGKMRYAMSLGDQWEPERISKLCVWTLGWTTGKGETLNNNKI